MIKEENCCKYCRCRQFNPYSDKAQCGLGLVMDTACTHYEIGNSDYASTDDGYNEDTTGE